MPRLGKASITGRRPKLNSRNTRIKIAQPAYRPIHIKQKRLIQRGKYQPNPAWWILHKRGLMRPRVGVDPKEARAISHDLVKGTLPERIVYQYLLRMAFIPDVDFSFQSCLTPGHRVLTEDLRWVPVETLRPGDKLLNFTEEHTDDNSRHMRKWETGTVLTNEMGESEVIEVLLSDGSTITATPEHPWLVNYSKAKHCTGKNTPFTWMRTDHLRPGIVIPRFLRVWDDDLSYEAGWLAGFFDGEGSVIHGKTQVGGHAVTLTISQNKGEMFDRLVELTRRCGYEFSVYDYAGKYQRSYDDGKRQVVNLRIAGGRPEALRFLGSVRPAKLIRLDTEKLGRLTKMDSVTVVQVRPAGVQKICRLGVSNHTYLAEGFGMHNSLEGGRIEMGGIVVDFLFERTKMVLQVQGPTHDTFLRSRKDEEQAAILSAMGYRVESITMEVIYDEPRFEDEMRRIFGMVGYYGGHVYGPHSVPEEGQYDDILQISARVDTLYDLVLQAERHLGGL